MGTDVHHIFLITEKLHLLILDATVGIQLQFHGGVHRFFVVHTQRIIFFRLIVFTHGIAYPVIAQIEASHIGVSDEHYAIEVEHFTFQEVCVFPDVANGREFGMFPVESGGANRNPFAGNGRLQLLHYAKSAR